MVNHWIFTVKHHRVERQIKKGIEIYKMRMADGFWGLKEGVRNSTKLRAGDYVVFYLAGSGGQSFLGICTLDSKHYRLSRTEKNRYTHQPFLRSRYGVKLANIDSWDVPVPIGRLRSKLDFMKIVKDPKRWGSVLQGSVLAISEKDYITIVSSYEQEKMTEQSSIEEPRLTDEPTYTEVRRKVREAAFTEKIREIYEYSCALCGKRRFTCSNHPEVESSHIYPKSKSGSDDFRNGIDLCRLHHWAFDGGLFSIRDDYSIIVEDRIRNDSNYEEISRFENKKIRCPKDQRFWPHPSFLKEHRKLHGFE